MIVHTQLVDRLEYIRRHVIWSWTRRSQSLQILNLRFELRGNFWKKKQKKFISRLFDQKWDTTNRLPYTTNP